MQSTNSMILKGVLDSRELELLDNVALDVFKILNEKVDSGVDQTQWEDWGSRAYHMAVTFIAARRDLLDEVEIVKETQI